MDQSSRLVKEIGIKNTGRNKKQKGSLRKQFFIALCVNIGHILVGFVVCWSAPMIPKLQNKDSSPLAYLVSDTEASWIASMMTFGVIVGAQFSGYLSNRIGKKATLILMAIFDLIGNIVLLVADTILMLYLGRFIFGMGTGGSAVLNMVYIGEIASPKIRGTILTSTGVSHTCGGLLVYAVAPFVSYSVVGYIGIFVSVLYVLGSFYIIESPVYYVMKGKNDNARITLHKLGRKEDAENELNTMIQNNKQQRKRGLTQVKLEWLEIFTIKRNRKAFLITTVLLSIQQTNGIMCIMFFATAIFNKAASSVRPDIATIILGVTQVFGTLLTPYYVERFGRRTLMLISTSFCGLCTALIGVHFYLELIKHPILYNIRWVPLVLLISFLFFCGIGLGIIPNALVGELFGSNVRGTGSSLAMCVGWIAGCCSTLSFDYIITAYGSHIVFIIFTFINFLGFLFTVVFVPETKGKSLMEIEEMLAR